MKISEEEKRIIRAYARDSLTGKIDASSSLRRKQVVDIFRLHLAELNQPDTCVELLFVSEIDNKRPDLALRARYRREIASVAE